MAAIDLLMIDDYRRRLSGERPTGEQLQASLARRAAVERALSPTELAVVDRVMAGDGRGCVAEQVGVLGGPVPDRDDEFEAMTVILGREPRHGG